VICTLFKRKSKDTDKVFVFYSIYVVICLLNICIFTFQKPIGKIVERAVKPNLSDASNDEIRFLDLETALNFFLLFVFHSLSQFHCVHVTFERKPPSLYRATCRIMVMMNYVSITNLLFHFWSIRFIVLLSCRNVKKHISSFWFQYEVK